MVKRPRSEWSAALELGNENGWQVDAETGQLLDADSDFSEDTNCERAEFRERIAGLRADRKRQQREDSAAATPQEVLRGDAAQTLSPNRRRPPSPPRRSASVQHLVDDGSDDNGSDYDGIDDNVHWGEVARQDDGGQSQQSDEDERQVLPGVSYPSVRDVGDPCLPLDEPEAYAVVPENASHFFYTDTFTGEQFTQQWVEEALNFGLERWCNLDDDHPLERACENFQLPWDGRSFPIPRLVIGNLHNNYRIEMSAFFELGDRAAAANLLRTGARADLTRILNAISSSFTMLSGLVGFARTMDPSFVAPSMQLTEIHPNVTTLPEAPYQRIVLFLLHKIRESGYRKLDGNLYTRVRNNAGVFVHTYTKACSILEYLYTVINSRERPELWQGFCKEGNVAGSLETYLKNCTEKELPTLEPNRNIHSFDNGLYFVQEDEFLPWGSRRISGAFVACKFHPHRFDPHNNLSGVDMEGNDNDTGPRTRGTAYDIPTPHFDTIMNTQEFPYSARIWMYVFLGRMLYWVGDEDNWQVALYHYGESQTGKSTICSLFGNVVYDMENTVNFSSEGMEKTFGLSPMENKYLVYCPEVSEKFMLPVTDLQSMISGERIMINVKNETARSVEWRAPMMFAGNSFMRANDTKGALARRFVIFHYKNKVTKTDTNLLKNIAKEVPAIILKCNRFYRAAREYVGSRVLREVLPPYFRTTSTLFRNERSPVFAFLAQEEEFKIQACDPENPAANPLYMPLKLLKDKFKAYKSRQRITAKWNEACDEAFAEFGIHTLRARKHFPSDPDHNSNAYIYFAFGITLASGGSDDESVMNPDFAPTL